MTLFEYMSKNHLLARQGSNKCLCPFHGDKSPSAMCNLNSIYCFSCSRTYTLNDFWNTFHVHIDRVVETSNNLESIKGNTGFTPNEVLFKYPWKR